MSRHDYERGLSEGRQEGIDALVATKDAAAKRLDEMRRDRDEWKQQHENLLAVRQQDIAALVGRAASPVQGAASAPVCPDCKGERGEEVAYSTTSYGWRPCSTCCPSEAATSSASGAKGAAVKPWEEREPTAHGYDQNNKRYNAMAAEIKDWRALADRSPAVQPSGTVPDIGVLQEQSAAWFAVCAALTELHPRWQKKAHRGLDAAVATIRSLATPAPEQEAAPLDLMGLIEQAQKIPSSLATSTVELTPIQIAWIVGKSRAAPVEQEAAQVGAVGQWLRCTPNLILAGVDCGNTPRRWNEEAGNHEHFISFTAPVPATTPAEQPEPKEGV